jgi:hypothetical protein
VAGCTEAQACVRHVYQLSSLILDSLQIRPSVVLPLSNHVGRYKRRSSIVDQDAVDAVPETVSRPPALPDLPRKRASSILVQPLAYIPSKIYPPSSACGPDTLGGHGPSFRM